MENFKEAVEIISKIERLGFEAVIVGGAIRDKLLSLTSYDIDIATSMPIEEIAKHFTTIDNGSGYLSITILYNDNSYEITSFRRDITYLDHRHPTVEYVSSYKEDSLRRDFTINALAYTAKGEILDYHNGLEDLNKRLIRAIGDPDRRFLEDALRILRALYLSAKLDFIIEDKTLASIIKNKPLLNTLSAERLYSYFYRILNSKYHRGIDYINEYDLFEYIPVFKKWLVVARPGLNKSNLIYSYFISYNELPLNTSYEKRICSGIKELLDNEFSNISLYYNSEEYLEAREAFKALGYDVIKIDKKLESLAIKNDSELKVTKEEISGYFIGKEKGIMIKKVVEAILNNEIANTKEDILNFLGRR